MVQPFPTQGLNRIERNLPNQRTNAFRDVCKQIDNRQGVLLRAAQTRRIGPVGIPDRCRHQRHSGVLRPT